MGNQNRIQLDLDIDRIRTIVRESFKTVKDVLDIDIEITEDTFVSTIEPYLESNRVTIPILLDVPNQKYPGMKIEVNLRRAKVFARIPSRRRAHPKQVLLNRYLKVL